MTSMKSTYPPRTTNRSSTVLRLFAWVACLALGGSALSARQAYVFDNEGLYPTQFPSADGWTIASADRVGKVEVTRYGLDYQIDGGAFLNGGVRALRLKGALNPNAMNNYLTYNASGPIATTGPLYFRFTMEAESLGISTDKHELFLRLNSDWNHYVAVKLYDGKLELPGAQADITGAAGVTYLVVVRIDTDGSGNITAMHAWFNPAREDSASPDLSITRPGTVPLANLTRIELRSQKTVTVVDELKFGTSWDDVVPPVPSNPGNLIVTLPTDIDPNTPGYQITGGTLFVEVGGADYVANTPLSPGTEVTFRMIPDTANDYVLTGWRGYKGPRDSWQPFHDFTDATILGTPSDTEVSLVIPIYAPLNIRPIFEFGDYRMVYVPNGGTLFRVTTPGGASGNRLRTLFDAGETVVFRAIGLANYDFGAWISPAGVSSTDTTPNLTVGSGVLSGSVTNIEARRNFAVLDYMALGVVDLIGPNTNGIEFEADNLGAAGSVPLSVMRSIVAEKYPQGLAGVINFETLVGDSGTLLYDPSPANDTPVPGPLVLNRDAQGKYTATGTFLRGTYKVRAQIGSAQIDVAPGPKYYTELSGAAYLATAAGPGVPAPVIDNNYWYDGGAIGPFTLSGNPSARAPVSGDVAHGLVTSYDYVFKASDKVVMAGVVYLSRNDFQHNNPDGLERLWAQAHYSNGSSSAVLRSTKLRQSAGLHDHFFGFESPAGAYITSIRVWCRGSNNRAFTSADDLVIVLEGSNNYTVTGAPINPVFGSVVGGGVVQDGGTAILTAIPAPGATFVGWAYAGDPNAAILGIDLAITVPVHGSKSLKALFEHPSFAVQEVESVGGNVGIEWYGLSGFKYRVKKSDDLNTWQATSTSPYLGADANLSHTEPLPAGGRLFLQVESQFAP